MINIIIPMAGAGSRFKAEGYKKPKPFTDVNGKMMIERVLNGVQYPNAHYTLIIQKAFEEENKKELQKIKNVAYISVEKLTQGACCTALAAHEIINNDYGVVFVDSDNVFNPLAFQAFVNDCFHRKLDGSLLTVNASDPCYSYAQTNAEGVVIQTREKEVISHHAITGAYMFARGKNFVNCAMEMLIYGERTKNEFYMSNVYNIAVKRGLKTGVYDIDLNDWHCLGTPKQLQAYLKEKKQ